MALLLFHGSSADARRGGGQQSTAGRTAPNHRVERTATSRCDFDTFGVMKIIRHSLSARSVAVAHPFRSEVLDQLREMASDVTRPHSFDFYLYVPTELAARQAADKVRESEFAAEVLPGASGS